MSTRIAVYEYGKKVEGKCSLTRKGVSVRYQGQGLTLSVSPARYLDDPGTVEIGADKGCEGTNDDVLGLLRHAGEACCIPAGHGWIEEV